MRASNSVITQYLCWRRKLLLVSSVFLLFNITLSAQWQDSLYGNEWIDYKKSYLRVHVTRPGLQRLLVSELPSAWQDVDPGKWQLWHRGKEVHIIKATNTELIFYGELNNGASDSLVYFPSESRLNPYQSLFSDQGIYFLTTAPLPIRVPIQDIPFENSNEILKYHIQKDTVTFKDQFSFVTWWGNDLNQSYYDASNSWTGPTIGGPEATSSSPLPRELDLPYTLKKLYKENSAPLPAVEMLFNGVHIGAHDIRVESGGKRILGKSSFNGWGGRKINFELSEGDFTNEGSGNFKLYSVSKDTRDWFSISYYTISYPQNIDMGGLQQKEFYFPSIAKPQKQSLIITNIPGEIELYDISDKYNIKVIKGNTEQNIFKSTIQRTSTNPARVIAVKAGAYHAISKSQISEVNLDPIFLSDKQSFKNTGIISPDKYDYIIITNSILKEGAIEYARYRSGTEGGNHRTVVMLINDIYDQFNYGEPSPIAIRTFMRHMLSKGIRRNEHYLFLFGPSVSYPPYLTKELVDEVPTFGDPGSDNLLVAGLSGVNKDLQALPVGRLKAANNTEVSAYLNKVKAYEHEKLDIAWRKNVLHLSGGQSNSEIRALQDILSDLEPIIQESSYGGNVSKVVKTVTTVEKVDISKEVNEGVGLISYFGHGSQTVTDLDFGYVSEVSRGFRNTNRYPLMYFNGCGVGNIFTTRRTHILSDDWLVAPDKGAISIIANSYLSYVSPSTRHINAVYRSLFESDEIKSVGYMLRDANEQILLNNPSNYDKANLHQAILQGDPAIYVIRTDKPDYIIDRDEGIVVYSENTSTSIGNSSKLRVALIVKNGGKAIKNTNVPVQLKLQHKNGTTATEYYEIGGMSLVDTLWITIDKNENLDRIEVKLNPTDDIDEFSVSNNYSDLTLSWAEINNLKFYPSTPLRDLIPPLIGTAALNGRPLSNKSEISSIGDIQIVFRDDRSLAADSTLIKVYLKPCWDDLCSFQQLYFSSSLSSISRNSDEREMIIQVLNGIKLAPGDYELLIQATDRAGNSPVTPYTIQFSIAEKQKENNSVLIVSPNPASDFVRFKLEGISRENISYINTDIINSMGSTVLSERREINDIQTEWFWILPPHLPSGIYPYKVTILDEKQVEKIFRGKIIKK